MFFKCKTFIMYPTPITFNTVYFSQDFSSWKLFGDTL